MPSIKGICQNRSWGLVLDGPVTISPKEIIEHYCGLKYGVYCAAIYKHQKKEDPADYHYHVALVLRDKPQIKYTELPKYFQVQGKYVLNEKLKCKSRDFGKKMLMHHQYCMDQEKHPDENLSLEYAHKWTPPVTTDAGVVVADLSTKEWVMFSLESGLDFKQMMSLANLKRRADLMMDMDKYQKMISNYKRFTESKTVTKSLESFKPEVVEFVKANWKPDTSLVLSGASGMGKTELAKSLMTELHGDPKFISNLNALSHREAMQPIIFDDIDFTNFGRTKKIHILDVDNDRDIRVLYGTARIEAGTQRIFTTNALIPEQLFGKLDRAHTRRMSFVELDKFEKLYL